MDMSQRVRAILSFVQAADSDSFAAAGRVLGISSAAVSKNVASLEQALGVRLMNRTTRTLSLTDEGSAFLKQARIALDALDSAVDSVAAQRGETSGHVRISTSAGFGSDQLLPALPGLLTRYPALTVEADFDDRVIDLVAGPWPVEAHLLDPLIAAWLERVSANPAATRQKYCRSSNTTAVRWATVKNAGN